MRRKSFKYIKMVLTFIIIFFVSGCIGEATPSEDFNEAEYRKAFPKDIIKNDSIYFAKYNYSEDSKRKFDYYNSISNSLYNHGNNGKIIYDKQKINSIIYEFKYKNGLSEFIFLSNKKHTSIDYLYVCTIYTKKNKYSNILSCNEPDEIRENILLNKREIENTLLFEKIEAIRLPVENDPNRYYGVTTDKKVYDLKIENQKPDGIKEFEANGNKYYFWYYNDLKTDKEVDKYKIEY